MESLYDKEVLRFWKIVFRLDHMINTGSQKSHLYKELKEMNDNMYEMAEGFASEWELPF